MKIRETPHARWTDPRGSSEQESNTFDKHPLAAAYERSYTDSPPSALSFPLPPRFLPQFHLMLAADGEEFCGGRGLGCDSSSFLEYPLPCCLQVLPAAFLSSARFRRRQQMREEGNAAWQRSTPRRALEGRESIADAHSTRPAVHQIPRPSSGRQRLAGV